MTTEMGALKDRLSRFSFETIGGELTLPQRLARENRWSLEYARRVLLEYKRFALLAVTSDEICTPSEDVDQAWHLHLVYTESYWRDFCGVLGRPLHHGPTAGGVEESSRFVAAYRRTLERYRDTFGEWAPPDIWPDVDQRFGADLEWERVNTARHWVVLKPGWWTLVKDTRRDLLAAGAALLIIAAGLATYFFNLEWLLALALVFAAHVRVRHWRARDPRVPEGIPTLDAYDTAYLTGGGRATLRVALAALIADGTLEADDAAQLRVASPLRSAAHPVEQASYALAAARAYAGFADLAKAATTDHGMKDALRSIAARLRQLGLVKHWDPSFTLELLLFALGFVLAWAWADGPLRSGLVLAGFLAGVIVVWVGLPSRSYWRDRRRRLLESLRAGHASLTSRDPFRSTSRAEDLPLAAALFGLGAIGFAVVPDLEGLLGSPPREEDADAPDPSTAYAYGSSAGGCGGVGGCGASSGDGGGGCGGGGCGGGCGG